MLNRVADMEFNNQISVLTPNNWNTWKHDMQLLMHYDCWQFIIQTKPEQTDEEATYKIPVYRQQIYRWKEEDFRVVKIEAELILEANRLQLMKQDLEKAENAYLSSFTSKKSKTLPGATAAAHGYPNGKNDYQKKSGKGYRIWLIDENKLVETINVRFDENKRGINFRQKVNSNLGYNLNLPDYYDDEDDSDRVKDSLTSRLVSKTSTETPSTSEKPGVSSDNHSLIPCTEVKWIKYRKDNTESQGFSDLSEQQEALMVEVTIPNCYKQAIRSRDASKWHDAMDKEINVKERKVWDLVDHPDNIKILENRWVYTIKYDENNKIVRYKARLVARGNTQLRGESFDEDPEVYAEYQLHDALSYHTSQDGHYLTLNMHKTEISAIKLANELLFASETSMLMYTIYRCQHLLMPYARVRIQSRSRKRQLDMMQTRYT
ncbi:retrovirus-related Pol polyprotein from transposon RE1 [Trichonephila clavipes]|nr:retrovirus-related Pol polyprotein from transposon RE1 [Trichonephila clavipes]